MMEGSQMSSGSSEGLKEGESNNNGLGPQLMGTGGGNGNAGDQDYSRKIYKAKRMKQ